MSAAKHRRGAFCAKLGLDDCTAAALVTMMNRFFVPDVFLKVALELEVALGPPI